jgi:hypothetical protein
VGEDGDIVIRFLNSEGIGEVMIITNPSNNSEHRGSYYLISIQWLIGAEGEQQPVHIYTMDPGAGVHINVRVEGGSSAFVAPNGDVLATPPRSLSEMSTSPRVVNPPTPPKPRVAEVPDAKRAKALAAPPLPTLDGPDKDLNLDTLKSDFETSALMVTQCEPCDGSSIFGDQSASICSTSSNRDECRDMLLSALSECKLLKLGESGLQVVCELDQLTPEKNNARLYAGIINRKEGQTIGLTVKPPKAKDMRAYLQKARASTTGIGLALGTDLSENVKALLKKKMPDEQLRITLMESLKSDITNFSDGLQVIDANFDLVV